MKEASGGSGPSPGQGPSEWFQPGGLRRRAEELEARLRRGEGDPTLLVDAAKVLLLLDRPDDALRRVQAALRRSPDPRALLVKAEIHCELGESAEADAAIGRAVALDPSARWLQEGARLLESRDGFEEALKLLARAVRSEPRCAQARVELARSLLWHGRCAEAAGHAAEGARLAPRRPEPPRQLAAAAVLAGAPAKALPLLDRALELDPSDHEAWTLRGEALRLAGRLEEAEADLRRARGICLQSLGARINELLLQIGGGRRPDRGDFVAVIDEIPPEVYRGPEIPEGYLRNAAAWHPGLSRRMLERGLAALQGNRSWTPTFLWGGEGRPRVVRHVGFYPRGTLVQIQARMRFGDYRRVLSQLDGVVRSAPDNGYPYSHRGEVNLWVGRYAAAKRDFLKARKADPALLWPNVGLIAVDLFGGRLDAAERGLEEVGRLSSASILLPWRVELHRRRGRFGELLRELESFSEPAPFRPHVWMNRGLAHAALGQRGPAAEIHAAFLRHAPEFCADVRAGARLKGPAASILPCLKRFFEAGLAAMRGNRSRWLYTYFLPGGRMKAVRIQGVPRGRIPAQLQAYGALYCE